MRSTSDYGLARFIREKVEGFRIRGISSGNFRLHLDYLKVNDQLFGLLQRTGHDLAAIRAEWVSLDQYGPNLDKAIDYLKEYVWQSQYKTGSDKVYDYGNGGNSKAAFGQTKKADAHSHTRHH